ncbi:MAG TPA: HNH endonuclease signature motif containing protein [Tepidisphaeraceae bacterium]|jgi:hypothetical protein|nr:HNH endonuclease signature motif containing protein [Tepidisphaeraceae bacterium]
METLQITREQWKTCVVVPCYEVSDGGRVRDAKSHRVLRSWTTRKGYARITVQKGLACPKNYVVHRLVALTFLGDAGPDMQVAHLNGCPGDNRLQNLRWVTPSENQLHREMHGTSWHRQDRRTKFDQETVGLIRKEMLNGGSVSAIAAKYCVTTYTVWKIHQGCTRRTGDENKALSMDCIDALISACEQRFAPPKDGEDDNAPLADVTYTMIRSARTALNTLRILH